MKAQSNDLRKLLAYAPVGILFAGAAASQAKLQLFEKQSTIDKANQSKRYELNRIDYARRGSVYTSDGQPVAVDESLFDLNVDYSRCPNVESFWLQLGQASGIPSTEFEDGAAQKVKAKTWPQVLTSAQKKAVDLVRGEWRASGVSAISAGFRAYPLGASTSCLVGILRRKSEAATSDKAVKIAASEYPGQKTDRPLMDKLTGLENSQDKVLRGHDGRTVGVTDRSGKFLPMRIEADSERKEDGQNITLTIDSSLQEFATEQIRKAVESTHAASGVVVIEDPKTGDLLAVANWPSFEPYSSDGGYTSLQPSDGLNQAYMSAFEPGSMFKILTFAKALDCGAVSPNETFDCPGEKVVVPHAKPIKCILEGGKRAHGVIDPKTAIAVSCNIWAATLARKIGREEYLGFLHKLRIFDRPNLGVPGTINALFNHRDGGKEVQLAMLGFGQSINCTPVSLIGAFSSIANHGVRIQPRLIAKIGDKPTAQEQGVVVLKDSSCQEVIEGMKDVFDSKVGTGRALKMAGYELAGKTGTAQKIGGKGGHVSNFVGFIPAQDPKAVVLVMIDRPQTPKYYGAQLAGPVFCQVAKAVIRRLHIPPTGPASTVAQSNYTAPIVRAQPTLRATPALKAGPDVDVSISVTAATPRGGAPKVVTLLASKP